MTASQTLQEREKFLLEEPSVLENTSCWYRKISYLVILAMPVDHPVLPIGADFQFEGGDVVGLLCLFGNGPLCGNACQNLQEVEINLEGGAKKDVIWD